jgi:hypothetical protein
LPAHVVNNFQFPIYTFDIEAYNPATRPVVSYRNVVFDEAAVFSTMWERNAEQRKDE